MKHSWLVKAFLSVFLLFHLVGVFIAPNPASYLYQSLSFIYEPYMRTLGLAGTWGFFAPEPVTPQMYIDYIIALKDGKKINGRFPDEKSPYFFRDRQNRRMTLSRMILSLDDNMRNMFVRYLCNEYAGMESVQVWRVTGTQPTLEMVRSGNKKVTDPVDFKIEVFGTFYCSEKK